MIESYGPYKGKSSGGSAEDTCTLLVPEVISENPKNKKCSLDAWERHGKDRIASYYLFGPKYRFWWKLDFREKRLSRPFFMVGEVEKIVSAGKLTYANDFWICSRCV